MTKQQIEEIRALFAMFANCEAINESGEPNTLSIEEIQQFGSEGLDWLDGTHSRAAKAA